ncbi:MAG: hypothetical protein ACREU2_15385 [Steroidobacteraceae bacterium]
MSKWPSAAWSPTAAPFTHLKNVFVVPGFRGRDYDLALLRAIMAHPDLQTVTMTLTTADAHRLYS